MKSALVLGFLLLLNTLSASAYEGTSAFSTTNSLSLKSEFNNAKDKVRLITLLGPTCPSCLEGYAALNDILLKHPRNSISALIVWQPVTADDTILQASKISNSNLDRRVFQGWDASLSCARSFQKTLGLALPAQDVYLIYLPGREWSAKLPPKPDFWMHKLDWNYRADPHLLFDQNKFSSALNKALSHQKSSAKTAK